MISLGQKQRGGGGQNPQKEERGLGATLCIGVGVQHTWKLQSLGTDVLGNEICITPGQ